MFFGWNISSCFLGGAKQQANSTIVVYESTKRDKNNLLTLIFTTLSHWNGAKIYADHKELGFFYCLFLGFSRVF